MAHRLAPQAEQDLDDIWLHVARDSGSLEIANRLIDVITDRFAILASFPYLGRSREQSFGPGAMFREILGDIAEDNPDAARAPQWRFRRR